MIPAWHHSEYSTPICPLTKTTIKNYILQCWVMSEYPVYGPENMYVNKNITQIFK